MSQHEQKSLLVTGGAGYIGSHMVRQLRRLGHQVVVFDSLDRGNREAVGDAPLVQGDLLDTDALQTLFQAHSFDGVLHFAALAYVGESVDAPDRYYRNNVVGSMNLIDAMRAASVNRLVFSSTCATFGIPDQMPISEETTQKPINPYGESKLMVEKLLQDYAVGYGFRSVALRYFNAVGSSEDATIGEQHEPETHLLPLILFEALRIKAGGDPSDTKLAVFGDDLPTRDGTCVRDYVHVDDLCSAHTAALNRMFDFPSEGAEAFNLGISKGFTVLEVIEACRKVTGVDIQYKMAPRRAGDPPELVADARKATETLHWVPQYPDITASIEHAWRWFNENPPPQSSRQFPR